MIEPLIDLRKYSTEDAEKITCEFLRNVFCEVIEDAQQNNMEGEDLDNAEAFLKSLEHVMVVLERSDEFFKELFKDAPQQGDEPEGDLFDQAKAAKEIKVV